MRDEIGSGKMDPDYRVPKALGSDYRLLSRKNDTTKVAFKKAFTGQDGFHKTHPQLA